MTDANLDPILAAILGKKIEAIAKEMALVVERTSRSPIFQIKDFCTVVLDDRRRILSQEEGLPQMAYAMSASLDRLVEFFGDEIEPGDVFIQNDPYYGGNQAQDTAIFKPVFSDGRLRYWAGAKGHLVDLGGAVAGGYNPEATDLWAENIRIPPLKIYERGVLRPDVWNVLMENTRFPHYVEGDLLAQIGACRTAEVRLQTLVSRHGDELESHLEYLLDLTEHRMRDELRRIPDGRYPGEATYTHEGTSGDLESRTARLLVTVSDGHVVLDFDGTDPQYRHYYNGVYGTTYSAALAIFLMMVDPDIPHNDGVVRCIDVRVPVGTFLNAAFPAPCVQGNFVVQDVVAQALFGALADAVPERVTAGWNRGESHNLHGVDHRTGKPFYTVPFFSNKGGGGGTFGADGWSYIGMIACGGGYAAQDYEIFEAQTPVQILEHTYWQDSAGEGEYRGGLGVHFRYRLDTELTSSILGEDADQPFGLFGGREGKPNTYYAHFPGADRRRLVPNRTYRLPVGTEIEAYNAGGGGFGSPTARAAAAVLADTRNGFVSRAGAEAGYGVVIDEAGWAVDVEATRRLREAREAR